MTHAAGSPDLAHSSRRVLRHSSGNRFAKREATFQWGRVLQYIDCEGITRTGHFAGCRTSTTSDSQSIDQGLLTSVLLPKPHIREFDLTIVNREAMLEASIMD